MHFNRQDMGCAHYTWDQNRDKVSSVFAGQPSRRSFNRFNGDQVLFLINFYGTLSEDFNIRQARIIEWEIAHHLPVEIKSEVSVFNWIRDTATQPV